MKRLLPILFMFALPTFGFSQVPKQTRMFKPAPSYSLYETMIGFGDSRECGKVRIWSNDQKTVYIQTVIKRTVICFVANNQGLQEVLACELKDRRFAKRPMRIIFTDFSKELSSAGKQWHTIDGNNSMMVKVVYLPKRLKSAQDFVKSFERLVERYQLKNG